MAMGERPWLWLLPTEPDLAYDGHHFVRRPPQVEPIRSWEKTAASLQMKYTKV